MCLWPVRTLWLLGATGSVGHAIVDQLVTAQTFERIVAIGRRPARLIHPSLEHHPTSFHPDFLLPEGPVTDVVCAIGSNYVTSSRPEFWWIDFEVPLRVAREARARGAQRFILVSTLGAHRFAPMLFARAKGKLEHELRALGFADFHPIRPSFIEDSAVPRIWIEVQVSRLAVWLARRLPRFARSSLAPTTCNAVARSVVTRFPRNEK